MPSGSMFFPFSGQGSPFKLNKQQEGVSFFFPWMLSWLRLAGWISCLLAGLKKECRAGVIVSESPLLGARDRIHGSVSSKSGAAKRVDKGEASYWIRKPFYHRRTILRNAEWWVICRSIVPCKYWAGKSPAVWVWPGRATQWSQLWASMALG